MIIQKIAKTGETWDDRYAKTGNISDLTSVISHEQQGLIPLLDILHTPTETLIWNKTASGAGQLGIKAIVDILAGHIKAIINAELMTEEFYNKHKSIISEKMGLVVDNSITFEQLKELSDDYQTLINTYLYQMGNDRFNEN